MLSGAGKKHTVSHDDKSGATSVSHLETVSCGDPATVKTLLERAARVRTVGATAANDRSSRSHMVFLLSIHGSNAATGQRLNGTGQAVSVLTTVTSGLYNPQWLKDTNTVFLLHCRGSSPLSAPLVDGMCALNLTGNSPGNDKPGQFRKG